MRAFSRLFSQTTRMGRRSVVTGVLFAFAIVLVLVTSMVLTAVGEVARNANKLDDDRSQETTSGALQTFRFQLGATLNDYAAWDDAAQYVYAGDGMEWVISNYGDMTVNSDLFDVAVVVGADNETMIAYRNGTPMTAAVSDYFGKGILSLLERARSAGPQDVPEASGFLKTTDGIAAVGVALVRMKSGDLSVSPDQRRYLIFARHLNAAKVAKLSETYVIAGLHLADSSDRSPYFVDIADSAGTVLGKLVWTSRAPGDISYAKVRSIILVAIGVCGTFFLILLLIGALALKRLTKDEAQARSLAVHDRLSGLLNRAGLYGGLQVLIETARADRSDVLLFYLDLDGFKEVNDTYGHGTGDRLIRGVAAGLEILAPKGAVLARIGGDEFALAFCTADIDRVAATLSQDILDFFSEPFLIGERVATVGASIGLSSSPLGLIGSDEALRRADMAMYRAKEDGRGRFVAYDPEMDSDREERNALELELRDAIESGEIHIAFQPVVDATTHRMTGVEALARWTHPERGAVPPDVFIPIAETTGLIDSLGLFVLRGACREAVHWPGINVAVNVSPGQFRNPAFSDNVDAVLRDTGMDPARMTLEVTEGYFIQNPARARHTIGRLKALGIEIALDDFGAGFSSVGYLRQFGFNRMKIDRSLIAALDEHDRARDMLQATVALARSLDIPVTAEGIEREEQAMILRLCGCDELQGYFFGRPMDAAKIGVIVEQQTQLPGYRLGKAAA